MRAFQKYEKYLKERGWAGGRKRERETAARKLLFCTINVINIRENEEVKSVFAFVPRPPDVRLYVNPPLRTCVFVPASEQRVPMPMGDRRRG